MSLNCLRSLFVYCDLQHLCPVGFKFARRRKGVLSLFVKICMIPKNLEVSQNSGKLQENHDMCLN